jgi:hypothetical protein
VRDGLTGVAAAQTKVRAMHAVQATTDPVEPTILLGSKAALRHEAW